MEGEWKIDVVKLRLEVLRRFIRLQLRRNVDPNDLERLILVFELKCMR